MTAYATSQATGANYAETGNVAWNPGTFSLSTWFRFFAESASVRGIWGRYALTSNRVFRLEIDTLERLIGTVSLDGLNLKSVTLTTVTMIPYKWYLAMLIHDGTNLYVYLGDEDGTALASDSVAASGSPHSCTIPLMMGHSTLGLSSRVFENGSVDNCALWDGKALTSEERDFVYAAGAGVSLNTLQGGGANNPGEPSHYWKCDEDGGPYVDSVGSWDLSVTGTLTRKLGHVDEVVQAGAGASFYDPFDGGPFA